MSCIPHIRYIRPTHFPQNLPLTVEGQSGPPTNTLFLKPDHLMHHSKRHLDRLSRFCTIHGRRQQTDRQTNRTNAKLNLYQYALSCDHQGKKTGGVWKTAELALAASNGSHVALSQHVLSCGCGVQCVCDIRLWYFDGVEKTKCFYHPVTARQTDQHRTGQLDGELKRITQQRRLGTLYTHTRTHAHTHTHTHVIVFTIYSSISSITGD